MAQQTFKGLVSIPEFGHAAIGFVSILLNADGEKHAGIFRLPPAMDGVDIAKIGFLTGTVTTGDTLKIGIYTVDPATGNPTATAYKGMVAGTQVVGDGDDDTWFTVSLGTNASSVVAGDVVAVVIEYNSYVAGNLNIKYNASSGYSTITDFPYVDNNTGSWVKDDEVPLLALEDSGGNYYNLGEVYPWSAINILVNFSSSSDPDHRGLKFQLPFSFRMVGVWMTGDFDGDYDIKLYDSDGTSVLETLSVDANIRRAQARYPQTHMFASAHSLSKGVYYRVVIEPGAVALDLDDFDVDSAAIMDSLSGGQLFHYTQKKDAGWTDTTTKRPKMGILIDGFDDGVGGGSGGATWFAGE